MDDIPGNGNDEVLEVEYLPEKPEVKRIKGSGSTSIGEWKFWLLLKGVFLAATFGGAVWLLVAGLRNE